MKHENQSETAEFPTSRHTRRRHTGLAFATVGRLPPPQRGPFTFQQARCKTEQEETARVVAMHARMEEEYRLALSSSDQERARLEETIARLESELLGERQQQAIRYYSNSVPQVFS